MKFTILLTDGPENKFGPLSPSGSNVHQIRALHQVQLIEHIFGIFLALKYL